MSNTTTTTKATPKATAQKAKATGTKAAKPAAKVAATKAKKTTVIVEPGTDLNGPGSVEISADGSTMTFSNKTPLKFALAPKPKAPKAVAVAASPEIEPARRISGKGWIVPVAPVGPETYGKWAVLSRDAKVDVIVGGTVQRGSRTILETPEGLVELHSVQRKHGFERAWHAVIAETMEPVRLSDVVHSGLIIVRHEPEASSKANGGGTSSKGRGSALGAPMTHILRHLGVLGAKRAEAIAVVQALKSAGDWNGDVPREATVQTQLGWGRRGTVETKISDEAKFRLASVLAAVKG